jgi:hypothetical protein
MSWRPNRIEPCLRDEYPGAFVDLVSELIRESGRLGQRLPRTAQSAAELVGVMKC